MAFFVALARATQDAFHFATGGIVSPQSSHPHFVTRLSIAAGPDTTSKISAQYLEDKQHGKRQAAPGERWQDASGQGPGRVNCTQGLSHRETDMSRRTSHAGQCWHGHDAANLVSRHGVLRAHGGPPSPLRRGLQSDQEYFIALIIADSLVADPIADAPVQGLQPPRCQPAPTNP